jgi:hypothetical protein
MSGGESQQSSEDESAGPAVPKGTTRSARWEGEELEIAREREAVAKTSASAAVDLQQFRNVEVGKGYQARHVIRQPSARETSQPKIKDMMKERKKSKKRERDQHEEGETRHDSRLRKYLKCDGLRNFRKEIEKIVSSA